MWLRKLCTFLKRGPRGVNAASIARRFHHYTKCAKRVVTLCTPFVNRENGFHIACLKSQQVGLLASPSPPRHCKRPDIKSNGARQSNIIISSHNLLTHPRADTFLISIKFVTRHHWVVNQWKLVVIVYCARFHGNLTHTHEFWLKQLVRQKSDNRIFYFNCSRCNTLASSSIDVSSRCAVV